MWWGGYSVPARFLVPALPLVAPMIAVALGRLRSSTGIGVTGVLLAASLCSLATLLLHPSGRLMFNGNDGTSGLVEAWQGSVNLTAVLPSFIDLDWPTQLPWLALWLGASLVGGFITSAAERGGILCTRYLLRGCRVAAHRWRSCERGSRFDRPNSQHVDGAGRAAGAHAVVW